MGLREMYLSEMLTIMAEVPGDRADMFADCIRMAKELEARPRWIIIEEREPPRNATVVCMVRPMCGGEPYLHIAHEWRYEQHGKVTVAWLEARYGK